MPEMKGITVKIPADLHAEVKAYLEAHGMTMGEFIAQAVDNELHPKIQMTQEEPMERMRTLAFQVPDSLFQRVKAYLERNHMTQKQFVVGLIEAELEQDEAQYQASHPEEQEDKEGPGSELEEQPAAQEDDAPVDDFEAGSEEVSQEDDGVEEPGEEEAQETEEVFEDSEVLESDSLDDVEEVEDTELEEAQEDSLEDEESQEDEEAWEESTDQEDAQDEEEEQSFQPSMAW